MPTRQSEQMIRATERPIEPEYSLNWAWGDAKSGLTSIEYTCRCGNHIVMSPVQPEVDYTCFCGITHNTKAILVEMGLGPITL